MRFSDITGNVYNRWTVLGFSHIDAHKKTMWLCECVCGVRRAVYRGSLVMGKSKSCGCLGAEYQASHKGPNSASWKGGRKVRSGGYILIYKPHHLNADSHGYVPEHVFVMSEKMGRPLTREETVHHKNGIRSQNNIDNLELWSTNHPKGQRVADLIDFAKEILKKYHD